VQDRAFGPKARDSSRNATLMRARKKVTKAARERGRRALAQKPSAVAESEPVGLFGARRTVAPFLGRFVIVAGIGLGLYYFPYDPRSFPARCMHHYLAAYAHLAGAAVRFFDSRVRVIGTDILGRFNLTFAMNCDAMDVFILFSSAVLSFPSTWRHRSLGLTAGLVTLVTLNVVRITSLYWVGVHFPRAFELLHIDLWPMAIVGATSGGFLLWARATVSASGTPSADKA